ncbi:MAG TPA: G1 family glutamic endopeptidase [Candidatus Bathyarchaeia archaeon]|nr:G1 family glutamic endopeptidase [Candidatus Bathyarchaeia archaeon]
MSKLLFPMLTVLSLFAAFPVVSASTTVAFAGSHSGFNCPTAACSTNWSGYAVTGPNGSVSSVQGSWIVPSVTCSGRKSTTYSSYWVGIDGYSSNTVEQTGTDSDCSNGQGNYYAWYEFYPNPSILISGFTISPGDKVSASVTYSTSTGLFTTTITDGSHSFSTSSSVAGAARSSAEWIVERPALCRGTRCTLTSLSNFGTVSLGGDYTGISGTNYATVSSTSGTIGSFSSNVAITMVNSSGKTLAEPSTLTSDGTSFTETWFASN